MCTDGKNLRRGMDILLSVLHLRLPVSENLLLVAD